MALWGDEKGVSPLLASSCPRTIRCSVRWQFSRFVSNRNAFPDVKPADNVSIRNRMRNLITIIDVSIRNRTQHLIIAVRYLSGLRIRKPGAGHTTHNVKEKCS